LNKLKLPLKTSHAHCPAGEFEYDGDFSDAAPEGQGTKKLRGGVTLIGTFKQGKMEGSAVVYDPEGTKWCGSMTEDRKDGKWISETDGAHSRGVKTEHMFVNGGEDRRKRRKLE
jgi:hypothetical protein